MIPRDNKHSDELNEMFTKGENQLGKALYQDDHYKECFPHNRATATTTTTDLHQGTIKPSCLLNFSSTFGHAFSYIMFSLFFYRLSFPNA